MTSPAAPAPMTATRGEDVDAVPRSPTALVAARITVLDCEDPNMIEEDTSRFSNRVQDNREEKIYMCNMQPI